MERTELIRLMAQISPKNIPSYPITPISPILSFPKSSSPSSGCVSRRATASLR
jgi:pyruvate/2-oxoacid:ferredoxin oxidoreductase alpha subunit